MLFATDAGGVGLNLYRTASACINLELPWNPAVLEQRVGRIHRLGQQRPIDVYNLVSEPGIESRIADVVGSKRALFTGLFDGTSDEVAFERSAGFLARIEPSVVAGFTEASSHAAGTDLEETAAEREIDATLAAGDESLDPPAAPIPSAVPASEPLPSPGDIRRIVAGLTVRRSASGGLVIEAPPDTASTLAALFTGMAQLLERAVG